MRNISKPTIADHRRGWKHVGALLRAFVLTLAAFQSLGRADTPPIVVTHVVTIAGLKFTPSWIKIHLGDRVIFKNEDIMPHSATAKNPGGFDSDMIKAGESWSVTPAREGSIKYACKYHPNMEGVILVERP